MFTHKHTSVSMWDVWKDSREMLRNEGPGDAAAHSFVPLEY